MTSLTPCFGSAGCAEASRGGGQQVHTVASPESTRALGGLGERVELFDTSASTALVAAVLVGAFLALVWWRAGAMARAEAARGADRRRSDLARQEAAEQLHAVVENAIDGIITIDARGVITSWNPAAGRIFGYAADEVIGQRIETLMPEPYRSEHAGYLTRYLRTGERRIIGIGREVTGLRKDGSAFPMELGVAEARVGDRRSFTGTVRDITERKRAEQEREYLLESERVARSEAERAARMKDEFLATLSHELRTPLSAILGWVGILERSRTDEETRARAVEVIRRNARAQAQLIEDLLDVSRIVAGKLRLDVEAVDLTRATDGVVAGLQPVADAKRVTVERALEGPVWTRGDPGRIEQVARNLVSNAIKFTPAGGVITVEVRRAGEQAELVVSDTGTGIRAEVLPHIFERFRQADASTTRKYGGLGLGLAIVRHVVDVLGGAVVAESAGEGRGARFVVRLPLSAEPSARATTASAAGISLRGVKVLVVDDELDARELLRRILEEHGAEVLTVGAAEMALHELPLFRPNVLLSDIGMPGLDGYQLMRAVRALGASNGGETPAAAVTAFARPEDEQLARLAGYQIYVSKPVDHHALVHVVADLSRRSVS